jgi:amino acid transporter
MTAQQLQKNGIKVVLLSVVVSIIVFLLHYITFVEELIYIEYLFIFLALAINVIIILRIINHTNKHRRNKKPLRILMVFNVIAIVLLLLTFRYISGLLDTLRINLVNTSTYELRDIKLTGCQKTRIQALKPGDDYSVSIKVSRNCSLGIIYTENGAQKSKVLSAFVTESMGQKLTFEIGGNN